jgi:hypothetical protein
MTTEEQQMLQGLVNRVNQTSLTEKDPDAEQFIQKTLGQADALYILAQTTLVQQYALDQAQKQLADLRTQLDQAKRQAAEPKHATSFLGSLLGHHDEPAPPPPPPAPVVAQPQYASPGYGPGLMYPSGGYPIAGMPQQGGFLRSAMQTAAGVAAGALAFEGVESLMHGFGHAAGYGTEFGGSGFGNAGLDGQRPEEIVNNYYGDASPHEHSGDTAAGIDRPADWSPSGSSSDAGSPQLHDASYVTDGSDLSTDPGNDADDLSGTADTDYSASGDDSMLSDDVGSDDQASDGGLGGDDSGGGFDSGGGDGF